jgi:hypothetical protein
MRAWLIKKLGGLPIKGLTEEEKHEILTLATAELFNTITDKDILRVEDGVTMWGDKSLNELQIASLRNDVSAFQQTALYKILDAEVKYHCNKKMRTATTTLELIASQMIEYTWDVIKTRMKRI